MSDNLEIFIGGVIALVCLLVGIGLGVLALRLL